LTNRIFQRRGRDKLHIIAEILEIAKEGVLKTQIMYRANLSFTQLNDYLNFMLKNELLEKVLSNNREVYIATEKGIIFLQSYNEITELVGTKQKNEELAQVEHKKSFKRGLAK
jgi:predicted transcriptional regulator